MDEQRIAMYGRRTTWWNGSLATILAQDIANYTHLVALMLDRPLPKFLQKSDRFPTRLRESA